MSQYVHISSRYLYDFATNGEGGYSLRKLGSTYTRCIRIRRSSDNAETDIGFDGIDLDTAAITAFVGANSAYVTKWYDQTTNLWHLLQPSAGNQPRIVNAGTLETVNGKPAINFIASANNYLFNSSQTSTLMHGFDKPISFVTVLKQKTLTYQEFHSFGYSVNPTPQYTPVAANVGVYYNCKRDDVSLIKTTTYNTTNTNHNLFITLNPGKTQTVYRNGVNIQNLFDIDVGFTTLDRFGVGALVRNTVVGYLDAYVQEVNVFSTDITPQKAPIEFNVNNYWSVY